MSKTLKTLERVANGKIIRDQIWYNVRQELRVIRNPVRLSESEVAINNALDRFVRALERLLKLLGL